MLSNCAFAQSTLQNSPKADTDCSKALDANGKNVKAQLRRAIAGCEMYIRGAALKDVEDVTETLPEDQKGDIEEMKQNIERRHAAEEDPASARKCRAWGAP